MQLGRVISLGMLQPFVLHTEQIFIAVPIALYSACAHEYQHTERSICPSAKKTPFTGTIFLFSAGLAPGKTSLAASTASYVSIEL